MHEDIPDEELHRRLLVGDPTATALIAERYLVAVVRQLHSRYTNLNDPAFIEDAVHTAFINYFSNPAIYDPTKSSLRTFLYMAANGDLLNLLKQEERRQDRQPVRLDHVELRSTDAEYLMDNTNNPDQQDIEQSDIGARIREALPDPTDQQLLALMMDGERKTQVYAQVLGVASLPIKEQEAQVKRHKDRIKKRLQRARIWTNDT